MCGCFTLVPGLGVLELGFKWQWGWLVGGGGVWVVHHNNKYQALGFHLVDEIEISFEFFVISTELLVSCVCFCYFLTFPFAGTSHHIISF